MQERLVTMNAGHTLETYLLRAADSTQLAVLLHPWSWLGGNCHDPILQDVADALHASNHHVLRFNSRGVGQSTGRSSFSGQAETDDLRELVQKTIDDNLPNITRLAIVGYSHGSMIASRYPLDALKNHPTPVEIRHVLISYPLAYRGVLTLFSSSTYQTALSNLTRDPNSRVLILYGDRDDFTGISKYTPWSEELRENAKGELKVELVLGGTHFWQGKHRRALVAHVAQWLAGTLEPDHRSGST